MTSNCTDPVTPIPEEIPPNPKKYSPEISSRTLWGTFGAPLKWTNIIVLAVFHVIAVFTLITAPYSKHFKGFIWVHFYGFIGGLGIAAGAHRLWCHRSYKAKLPLSIILIILYSMAGQNPVFNWVRDHRVHHKFSETDADPHNSNRGFFFAHVGWLMMKKHPEVLIKGKQVDCSDLLQDPVVVFHAKYYWPMQIFFSFILCAMVPYLLLNVPLYWCWMGTISRYVISLHITWFVNSWAHMYGNRPYNGNIEPTENKVVAFITYGEGWHNYHHTFPWDYKAAELGSSLVNLSTLFIDVFAKIGWAYDLKSPSKELIHKTILANGDGSHKLS